MIEAIRELYVLKGEFKLALLEALIKAKQLREDADYYGDFSKGNAARLIENASEFIEDVRKIIKK